MHKDILRIALPAIISNITVPLLSLIDLAIVGHLGSTVYIGAIALGGMLFNMIYWAFGFLRMGTSGLTAQAYGAGNSSEIRHTLLRSLAISMAIALTIIILQIPVLYIALHFIKASPEVQTATAVYFKICVWAAPAYLGLYSWTGWYIGMQNSRYPMLIAIVQNLTNIAASLFLVYVYQWKLEGIALGTVIAQYTGFLLACALGYRMLDKNYKQFVWKSVFSSVQMKKFFIINRDIFLRTLCMIAVTAFFTSAGAAFGDLTLAANALLIQLFTLFSYFMDGFAYAGEALSGRYFGASDSTRLNGVIKQLFIWGAGVTLFFTIIYAIWGTAFLHLLTDRQEVIHQAQKYWLWVLLIPLTSVSAFILDGICIGITATDKMLKSMFTAACAFFIVYYLTTDIWQNDGLWLAFIVYLSVRGGVQGWLLHRNQNYLRFPSR